MQKISEGGKKAVSPLLKFQISFFPTLLFCQLNFLKFILKKLRISLKKIAFKIVNELLKLIM